MQFLQNALTKYIVKNGSQQQTNPPTIMPKVLAALVSIRNRLTWKRRDLYLVSELTNP